MGDNWYTSFEQWANEHSPTGEWVYRGQAARFDSIVPSLMRPGQREHHQNRGLFDVNYDVARAIFDSSPTFGTDSLHPVISDAMGGQIEDIAAMMGSAPSIHPQVSFPELIRALAQHYDYPTFFIDVSFHPVVSALFASHSFGSDGYRVSGEEGVLFRWPVERKSERRCEIRGTIDGESIALGVIDIRGIHPLARRPSTQYAALATPVHDPKPIYQPFQSALDTLECVDMTMLDCCQRFDLPADAGTVLSKRTGVQMAGLFPDRVDLGFSYVALIALLSLTIHRPENTDGDDAVILDKMFERIIDVARALLDRECYRLDSGVEITSHSLRYTLVDLQSAIHLQAELARRAIEVQKTPEVQERRQIAMQKRLADMQSIAKMRFDAWKKAVRDVLGDEAADELGDAPQYTLTHGDWDWVLGEIDRRLSRVEPILNTADWLPQWALDDSPRAEQLRAVLNSNEEYEANLTDQLRVTRETVLALERFGR